MDSKSKAKSKSSTASSTGATTTATATLDRPSRRDTPTSKRQRGESDAEYETSAEVGPEVIVDPLLSYLYKNETLLNGFIEDLFQDVEGA